MFYFPSIPSLTFPVWASTRPFLRNGFFMSIFRERTFCFQGYAHVLFFFLLTLYVGLSPPGIFFRRDMA